MSKKNSELVQLLNASHCPEKVTDIKSTFVKHLLNMDQRIRVFRSLFSEIMYNMDLSYFIRHNHIFLTYSLPSIEHEIAHLIEMKDQSRWVLDDFGFKTFHSETEMKPQTIFRAFSRELRVGGIQDHMMNSPRSIEERWDNSV